MSTPGPGQLLFAFVRHWSRRSLGGDGAIAERGRIVMVTEAVAALLDRNATATVNAVADELGIDQSVASRLVKEAMAAGYLTMAPASTDRPRREVVVTPKGRTPSGTRTHGKSASSPS